METKKRYVYEVLLSEIVGWDPENNCPDEMNPVQHVEGVETSFITTSISDAYRFYREYKDCISDNQIWELSAREIEVDDNEWAGLVNKGRLELLDFLKYEITFSIRVLCWNYSYMGETDTEDSALKELLIREAENFNMHVICEKAGISYSAYNGFKNNNHPISEMDMYKLLKTMYSVGNECWDEDLEMRYRSISE